MTRFTGTGDENRFHNERQARLEQMDTDFAGEQPIEILPTFTDGDGVEWQMPHDKGWARLCFDALMDGGVMIVETKHPSKYKMQRGQMVACEWEHEKLTVMKYGKTWRIQGNNGELYYPPSDTYRVFVMAVGLNYDFSGVVLV